jgi:hypothetical protein
VANVSTSLSIARKIEHFMRGFQWSFRRRELTQQSGILRKMLRQLRVPSDCGVAGPRVRRGLGLGVVDSYRSHKMMAERVTTAR